MSSKNVSRICLILLNIIGLCSFFFVIGILLFASARLPLLLGNTFSRINIIKMLFVPLTLLMTLGCLSDLLKSSFSELISLVLNFIICGYSLTLKGSVSSFYWLFLVLFIFNFVFLLERHRERKGVERESEAIKTQSNKQRIHESIQWLKGKKLYVGIFAVILLCLLGFIGVKEYFFPFGGAFSFMSSANSKVSVKWLIEPKFHNARSFSSGFAWVQENENGSWKLIDKEGKVIVDNFQANFIYGHDQKTGLAEFKNREGLYGFANLSGDIVISPEYQFVGSFRDGMTSVTKKVDGKEVSGVIDHHGKIVMPMIYESIYPIASNLFTVEKEKKWGAVNKKGEVIIDFFLEAPLEFVSPNALAAVVTRKEIGFDSEANVYIPGYQRVGLISDTGQWILPASYDQIYPMGEGLIGLEKDRTVGFVDAQGSLVIDFKFVGNALPKGVSLARENYFSDELAVVDLTRGSLAPPFSPAKIFLSAVIDHTGKIIFEFQGYALAPFSRGLLVICRSGNPYQYEVRTRSGDSYPLPSGIEVINMREDSQSKSIILLVQTPEKTLRHEKGKYGYLEITPK